MNYYFNQEYEWPSERLYRKLIAEIVYKDSRFDNFLISYGGKSIFIRSF